MDFNVEWKFKENTWLGLFSGNQMYAVVIKPKNATVYGSKDNVKMKQMFEQNDVKFKWNSSFTTLARIETKRKQIHYQENTVKFQTVYGKNDYVYYPVFDTPQPTESYHILLDLKKNGLGKKNLELWKLNHDFPKEISMAKKKNYNCVFSYTDSKNEFKSKLKLNEEFDPRFLLLCCMPKILKHKRKSSKKKVVFDLLAIVAIFAGFQLLI